MDQWRTCTHTSAKHISHTTHYLFHEWQSLKLMWLLFAQINFWRRRNKKKMQKKRRCCDAAAWPKYALCACDLEWRMLKHIRLMAHIYLQHRHTAQSYHFQIEFELSDDVDRAHTWARHFSVGHTISLQHLYSWNDAQSFSLFFWPLSSAFVSFTPTDLCLHDAWCVY